MMTCSPLSHPEDLKPLIKTAIHLVTADEDAEDEYAALHFYLAPGELGIGSYLLLGLDPGSIPHMRMRDILLVQPDSRQDSTAGPQAWYPPPFLANPNQASRAGAEDATTPREVAAYLKTIYQPALQPGAVVVVRALVKMLVPQRPKAVHRQVRKLGNASGDGVRVGVRCVCRHGRTPLS